MRNRHASRDRIARTRQLFAVLLPDLNFGTDGTAPLEPSSQITPLTNGNIPALGGGCKTLVVTGLPDPNSRHQHWPVQHQPRPAERRGLPG